jgi:hypothetical protein
MVMTSDMVRHDLRRIEALIAALKSSYGDEDREDFYWLDAQRLYLRSLLAARNAQRGKKLVNLALWRDGGPETASRLAAAAAAAA